jgi:glycosyltransferase involved in cell wall biosynthesis
MKIVLAGDTYPPDVNGAAVFTERLAAGLASRGNEIHEIVPSPTGPPSLQQQDVVVPRIPSRHYPWHPTFRIADPWRAYRAVPEIIRQVRPDVVHVQSHFVIGRRAAKTAHLSGLPWVATNHFMPENLDGQLPLALPRPLFRLGASLAWRDLGRTYRTAEVVTSPTPVAVELLRRRAGVGDAIAISCGVDTHLFTPIVRTRHEAGAGRVLFVGRLEAEKRVHEIIRALAHLDSKITAVIVGCGSEEHALRRLSSNTGVAHRVQFLGYVNDARLREEYARADVFCMPGVAELQSIAMLEAMASGLPVIAADAYALPHLVHPGVNGELYRPGDIAGLATALNAVLADDDRRAIYRRASRELAISHDIRLTVEAYE